MSTVVIRFGQVRRTEGGKRLMYVHCVGLDISGSAKEVSALRLGRVHVW